MERDNNIIPKINIIVPVLCEKFLFLYTIAIIMPNINSRTIQFWVDIDIMVKVMITNKVVLFKSVKINPIEKIV